MNVIEANTINNKILLKIINFNTKLNYNSGTVKDILGTLSEVSVSQAIIIMEIINNELKTLITLNRSRFK